MDISFHKNIVSGAILIVLGYIFIVSDKNGCIMILAETQTDVKAFPEKGGSCMFEALFMVGVVAALFGLYSFDCWLTKG